MVGLNWFGMVRVGLLWFDSHPFKFEFSYFFYMFIVASAIYGLTIVNFNLIRQSWEILIPPIIIVLLTESCLFFSNILSPISFEPFTACFITILFNKIKTFFPDLLYYLIFYDRNPPIFYIFSIFYMHFVVKDENCLLKFLTKAFSYANLPFFWSNYPI